MANTTKKVTFYIEGSTLEELASWLELNTQVRKFKVDGGYLQLHHAQKLSYDPPWSQRIEIGLYTIMVLDEYEAAGHTTDRVNRGPQIRFLVSVIRSAPTVRHEVIALCHQWPWLPPALQAYFDDLLAAIGRAFDVKSIEPQLSAQPYAHAIEDQDEGVSSASNAEVAPGESLGVSTSKDGLAFWFENLPEEEQGVQLRQWNDKEKRTMVAIAKDLGISRKTLQRRFEKHGIVRKHPPGTSPNRGRYGKRS